jgi:aerobic carbon-monoxide dehydrogenase large subunit
MKPMKFGIGQSIRRVEDQRFITGAGRFASDYEPAGCLQAYVLRSPHAHADFTIGDLSDALAVPGVHLILTYQDVAQMREMQTQAPVDMADGSKFPKTPYPLLARETVKHVGDAVAFIVAETVEQAKDAAERIPVDYRMKDAVVDMRAALADGAPLVWPSRGTNNAFVTHVGHEKRTEAAFAKAAKVVSLDLVNNRIIANYMETRAIVAEYDKAGDAFTVTMGSQGSHIIQGSLAKILKLKKEQIRVITPDVGGGFGTKMMTYREYPLALIAARKLNRPVKWYQDRTDHFLSCAHGRDHLTTASMALDSRGKFLALKIETLANMGGYLSTFAPYIPYLMGRMATGSYAIKYAFIKITGVYTHTVPTDAYRGAGRPEAAYLIERLVDEVAAQTGKTPEVVRRKNFVKSSQMPFKTPVQREYDTGDFEGHMDRALIVADMAGFKTRAKAAQKRGKVLGYGLSTYIEACADGTPEPAYVTLEKDGNFTVKIGTQSSGQGHLTAYAQFVAQHFDVPVSQVNVRQGDTNDTPTGDGTGGSRSIPVGGVAVDGAAQNLVINVKQLASDVLEAGIGDLEMAGGAVRIVGTDKKVDLKAIANLPQATPDKLSTTHSWEPKEATYPNGTHLCEVELDPETGVVKIANYTIVDDFGLVINPLLLAGQVHGGVAQGIGQALLEGAAYSDDGQLLTASFQDYCMPRADDMPSFHFETRNILSTVNPLGIKGAGEAGTIGSAGAVMNAINNALSRAKGKHVIMDMPATPQRVWQVLQNA